MPTSESKVGIVIEAQDRATAKLKNVESSLGGMQKKMESLEPTFKRMATGGAIAFGALATGLGFAIAEAAKLETLEVAFTTMIGSAEKAQETIKGLRDFTARTPFQFEGVAKASRQLLSFGVTSEELQGKLKFLGDIAAGANVPLSDMAAIFGKAKAKGKAMTEELLQLSDRGVPIIAVLAKQLGVAESAVFDLASKSEISFDVLQKAMMSMSEEGGIFFDLMTKQSATVAGRFSTLKDNVQIVAQTIGQQFLPLVADLLEKMMPLIEGLGRWVEQNPQLTKTIIIATLALLGIVTVLGTIGLIIPTVITGIGLLGASMSAVLSASAVGLIVAGIVLIANNIKDIIGVLFDVELTWKDVWNSIIDFTSDVIAKIIPMIEPIVDIFSKIKSGMSDVAVKINRGVNNVAGRVLNEIDVQDAIITPRGDIVRPADDDFIIATKDPSSIGGGSTFNFDFKGANIMDKNSFMRDVTNAVNKSVSLSKEGVN